MPSTSPPQPWAAPEAPAPISATVTVPGSKSETNRALVLAALADRPSVITNGLDARDTVLMREALRTLGVVIVENGRQWLVTPPAQFTAGGTVQCGLAGTVMRFVPALAALADGDVRFEGDEQAASRPMAPLLDALTALGADSRTDGGPGLPFTVTGRAGLRGGAVTVDASTSSQYVSALLLVGARFADGLDLRHVGGPLPSLPHIAMTVAMLRERGVAVDDSEPGRWRVSPGVLHAHDVVVEPDLSNAAPFLAAAAVTGGMVTVRHWPAGSLQPGDQIRGILRAFGAEVTWFEGDLTVSGRHFLHGVDLDLREASELTPVVAAVAALAEGTSRISGVGHIRGHETDRLAALEAELSALGCSVSSDDDGLTVNPKLLGSAVFHTYADHRMAHAAAVLGLVVAGIVVDDVSCTSKTMPEFVDLWAAMVAETDAGIETVGAVDPERPAP
ncbi:3-phosphoshikimate 1-carboxyvinyltransferase [Friedmanniella luteola]|uniref:3-phosphoshikimate 1-carboxyvinyltransferase n=1 Tax=Friedmanniella luteola TaxID=546871 RepID=A0A1H1VBA0_9ACTN|nr:3-phosphoshikimate 1-carboxyvinyltransferase [Friedmanniella luteola]SDS82037.1 3-phosphoshikimate 1-carboxyvinyltransferase [Friedmanniella luteola]